MRRTLTMDLKKKLRGIFSLSAASAAFIQNSVLANSKPSEHNSLRSSVDKPQSVQPAPDKLVFEQADQDKIAKLYAGHTSHSSHSSHYSGSGSSSYSGSGGSTPAPYTGYSVPAAPQPAPPITYAVPQPAVHKDDPGYAARLLETKKQWADEGLPSYQYEIGMMYLTGNGLEKDEPKGWKYIGLAAAQGYEDAVKKLRERKRLESAESGSTKNFATNAVVLIEKPGTNQLNGASQPDSVKLLLSKAAGGSASAQYELGLRYVKGLGVEKNIEKGKSYLEMAAAQDQTDAASLLQTLKASGQ